MNGVAVHPLPLSAIVPIRWEILRPGFPRETAVFVGDDHPATLHFGAFFEGRLAGVASYYRMPLPEEPSVEPAWQLRGMATLPEVRGAGLGRALLVAGETAVRARGGILLWCNARRAAVGFYQKHGWAVRGEEFDIPTVGPHFRMVRR